MSTTFDDLVQQVNSLHDKLNTPLTLDDLPLADLRKQLIDNGDPLDLSVLAFANQIVDTGGQFTKIRGGSATMTWAASQDSNNCVIPHGMESVPTVVVAITDFTTATPVVFCVSKDATDITLLGRDVTGTARTGTNTVYWLALG